MRLLILISLCFLCGCTQSLQKQYATNQIIYTETINTIIQLHETKVIDDATILKINSYRLAASEYLNKMGEAVLADDEVNWKMYLKLFQQALIKLQGAYDAS